MTRSAKRKQRAAKKNAAARAPLIGDPVIAGNLKRALAGAGMSPAELAKHLKLSRQAANQWLNATTTPGARRLRQIAEVLKVSTEFLRQAPEIPQAAVQQPPKSAAQPQTRDHTVRLGAYPLGRASTSTDRWPLPAEWFHGLASDQADLAVMRVAGSDLKPDFTPGELVVVDRNWTRVSVAGFYLTGDRSYPVLRRCEIVAGPEAQIRVYEHGSERVMAASDLSICGRVICKWLTPC